MRTLERLCGEGAAPSTRAYVQACALELWWWRGRWPEARAAAEETLGLVLEPERDVLGCFAHGVLARVLAAQGSEDLCRRSVAVALGQYPATLRHPVPVYALSASGLLELGRGDAAAAVPLLRRAEEIRLACGCRDPRTVPFGPDLVEALARSGDVAEAARRLAEYDDAVLGAPTAWARATAARCHALLTRDHDEAERLFADALAHHAHSDAPFDTARTQLCWGERRRRRRDIAGSRPLLNEALEAFHLLGARPWARRAAAELRAAGGRPDHQTPPKLSGLSPQELRCALAAADGMSNREAAAMLFLSPKTVEYHLGKVFAKLGLTSRTQLARLLAGGADLPDAVADRGGGIQLS